MPYVDAGGLHTHYLDDYLGPQWLAPEVVLLQHGYAANVNHFATWVPELAGTFRVLRRDSVGHGRTSPGAVDRDLSLPALADDVVRFLDALGIDKVHYVGERTGAMTGVLLGARHPDRLQTLTLFGCPIACGEPLQTAMWQMLQPEEKRLYTGWNDAIRGMNGAFAWHDHVRWLESGDAAHDAWQREQLYLCDEALLERYARATIDYDIADELAQVRPPTLILSPTATYRTNFDQQIQLRTSIPDSEIYIAEGSVGRSDDPHAPDLAARVRRFAVGHRPH